MNNRITEAVKSNIFKRLLRDERGNTIIFMGASLIPLLALVGGGVDASRGYMAQARLQQACDAATLAGRRAVGDDSFDDNAEEQANRLFNANFETGFLGSVNTRFKAISIDDGNTVQGTASAEVPTVIMRIFGNNEITVSATCEAALNVANADVMMVLDTTGSMRFAPDGTDLGTDGNGDALSGSRMFALRDAAKSFYTVLENATSITNARVRYGFVPYTATVNVGNLITNNSGASLLTGNRAGDTHTYPSRRAVYEVEVDDGVATDQFDTTFRHTDGSDAFLTEQNCNRYANNQSFDYYTVANFRATFRSHNQINPGNPVTVGNTTSSFSFVSWQGGFRFPDGTLILRCTRRENTETQLIRIEETYDGTLPGATFLRFEYSNLTWPVDDYVSSIDPTNPAARRPSEREDEPAIFDRWEGCIEERDTVTADPEDIGYNSFSGITPADASDLDIDSIPTNVATRWRPYWPEIVYNRVNDSFTSFVQDSVANRGQLAFNNCPQPAQLLSELSQSQYNIYIDSLKPRGATYHDIGAIWGARLASPEGIFQANVNSAAPNNGFVSRNMIFLTDGTLEPNNTTYSAYGTEFQNPLVGPLNSTNDDLRLRHDARFLAVCSAIKAKKIRIFVVAFGTGLTDSLRSCASADSAFVANDADALNDRFLQIATNIADLRLTN